MSGCGGRQAIPPLPEGQADGLRPPWRALHPAGPGDPSQGGNGDKTNLRVKGWETARQGKSQCSLCFWDKSPKLFLRLSPSLRYLFIKKTFLNVTTKVKMIMMMKFDRLRVVLL